MSVWRIRHTLHKPLTVSRKIDSYPGVEVEYEDSRLVGLTHTTQVAGRKGRSIVIEESRAGLGLLLDLFEYLSGVPARIASSSPEELEDEGEGGSLGTGSFGISVALGSTNIMLAIDLPTPETLAHAPDRLGVWLRLANEARRAENPADAVRSYYMILEDYRGPPDRKDVRAYRLKLVRDFVSHGVAMRNQDVRNLIHSELATTVAQYDPTDRAHREFVEKVRRDARQLIESELMALLS